MDRSTDTGLEEVEHLREGFHRLNHLSNHATQRHHGIDKTTFRSMIFCSFPRIPSSLSERIFDVLNIEHSGLLQLDELLPVLELARHVSLERSNQDNSSESFSKLQAVSMEKQCRLLFAIYDVNDDGLLQYEVLERFMNIIYGARTLLLEIQPALKRLFLHSNLKQVSIQHGYIYIH